MATFHTVAHKGEFPKRSSQPDKNGQTLNNKKNYLASI